MTDYYVRSSDGADGDSGLSWALAKEHLGAAVTLAAAGDRIYVDDDHQEVVASDTTYAFAGTEGVPVEVIVVETDTTTAVSNYNSTIQWISGDTNNADIKITGEAYFWGIYLEQGDYVTFVSSGETVTFEQSKILMKSTGTDHIIVGVEDHSKLVLINCDVGFDALAGSELIINGPVSFIWRGGAYIGDQNNAFSVFHDGPYVEIVGVDLSSIVGGTLIKMAEGNDDGTRAYLKGIILNASVPDLITSGVSPERGSEIIMDIADNGSTVYKFRREYQYGYAQDETSKVITGKALYDGTNEFTAKMTSRATPIPTFYDPWRYHLTTLRETGFAASRTYTVHIAQDHADTQPDALDDDEIWLEVVYPDDANAKYNIKTDKIATPTTTPAAQTTSTETWTGLAATTRLQELSVQIDAADGKNGPVEIWVCLAKESKTVYVCPEVYVS